MYHVAAKEITSHPRGRPGGVPFAFIQLQRAGAVAWRDDDLCVLTWFEVSRPDATADGANWNGSELGVRVVFEPRIPSKQIDAAVDIHIERIYAFGILVSRFVRLFSCFSRVYCFSCPRSVSYGVFRNLG